MKKAILLISIFSSLLVLGQKRTFLSRSEIGLTAGQSYYLGDLNPYQQFKQANLAGGFIYRYNLNTRLNFRANYLYGKVAAADSSSPYPLLVNRNLSFESKLHEVAAGVEFHFTPFQFGSSRSGWVGDVPEYKFDLGKLGEVLGENPFRSSRSAARASIEWEWSQGQVAN